MFDAEKAARFREQADRLRGLITPEELVKERVYNPLAEVLETLAEMLEETETTVEGEEPTEVVLFPAQPVQLTESDYDFGKRVAAKIDAGEYSCNAVAKRGRGRPRRVQ